MPKAKRHPHSSLIFLLVLSAQADPAPILRVAQLDSRSYPLLTYNPQGQITGGLLKDLTDRLAQQLGTQANHLVYSRPRLEQAVLTGKADITCHSSPAWADPQAQNGNWSIPTLTQIERIVTRQDASLPDAPQPLKGKRLALILGYRYPSIQTQLNTHQIQRIDETRIDGLFRDLDIGTADALIATESEIEGYFHEHPANRPDYTISTEAFTRTATQCLISPHAPWSVTQINQALTTLRQQGELDRLAKQYGLSAP